MFCLWSQIYCLTRPRTKVTRNIKITRLTFSAYPSHGSQPSWKHLTHRFNKQSFKGLEDQWVRISENSTHLHCSHLQRCWEMRVLEKIIIKQGKRCHQLLLVLNLLLFSCHRTLSPIELVHYQYFICHMRLLIFNIFTPAFFPKHTTVCLGDISAWIKLSP